MHRQIASHLAVLAIGLAAGIGAVAAADSGQPTARSAASDTRIVNRLDDIQDQLQAINKSVSGFSTVGGSPSLAELLKDICRNTQGDRLSGC